MLHPVSIMPSVKNRRRLAAILASAGLLLNTPCHAADNPADEAIRALIARANSALASGQAQAAAELFEKAAGLAESPEAEIGLVRAYLQAGEFRKAIAFGNLVAAEHPDVNETLALLAYLEDREGQTAPALSKLKEARARFPDDIALLGANAEILLDRQAIPQAMRDLDDWIVRNQPQGDIYRLRARAALAAGNADEALIWREKAAQLSEAASELEQGKVLQENSAKAGGDQNTALTPPSTPHATGASAGVAGAAPIPGHWPAHYLESFPISQTQQISSGNGFVIDQGRRIVTNAALVSNANGDLLVRNGLGMIRKAKLEKILPEHGLALLLLEQPYAKEWSLPSPATTLPSGVRFCFVMGFPLADSLEAGYPVMSPGVVVRPDAGVGGLMQITATLGQENSGSPVLDGSGNLIGVTLGQHESIKGVGDRMAQLGKGDFAVRIDALQELLPEPAQTGEKTAKDKAAAGSPSVEELYEKLQPAVVFIVVPK